MRRLTYLLASALVAGITPAIAQTMPGHGGMASGGNKAAEPSMMESMNTMNQAMSRAPMTGDADHDFVVMMIPHHRGAVDMARFELSHGKDPALRTLARQIVAAQEKEISLMQAWLDKHSPK